MITEIKNKNLFEYISNNPNTTTFFEIIENETVKVEEKNPQEGIIWLSRQLLTNSINTIFGYYFVQILSGECTLEKLKSFLEFLEKYALKFTNSNFMYIEPIIIANDFPSTVVDFLDQYNITERRKAIKIFKRTT